MPQGNDLFAVWGASSSDVWAAGRAGTLLHWDGHEWRGVSAIVPADLHALHGSGPSDVWAVGNHGAIVRWDGVRWSALPSPGDYDLSGVWAENASSAWAVGQYFPTNPADKLLVPEADQEDGDDDGVEVVEQPRGVILHWDGHAWSVDHRGAGPLPALNTICGMSGSDLWVSSRFESAPLMHWDGTLWSAQEVRTGRSVLACGDGVWALSAEPGRVLHREDQGWTAEGLPLPATTTPVRALWAGKNREAWAMGGSGIAARRTERGWRTLAFPIKRDVFGVWGDGSGKAWAVGEAGAIARWDGQEWHADSDATRDNWNSVWGSSEDDVWATGPSGTLHWNGAEWRRSGPAAQAGWSPQTGETWIAAGPGLLHWDGTKWEHVDAPLDGHRINALRGSSATDIWAAGDAGVLVHRDSLGWHRIPMAKTTRLTALAGTGPNNVWVGGEAGFVRHYDGASWRTDDIAGDSTVLALASNGTDDAWALVSKGPAWQIGTRQIFHWSNSRWSELPLPHAGAFLRDLRLFGTAIIVSSTDGIYRWDGRGWHRIATGTQDGFLVLWADQKSIWAASTSGAIISLFRQR